MAGLSIPKQIPKDSAPNEIELQAASKKREFKFVNLSKFVNPSLVRNNLYLSLSPPLNQDNLTFYMFLCRKHFHFAPLSIVNY